MSNHFELISLLISFSCIFFSQLIDFYSYHIKYDFLKKGKTELISVANWLQYVGRIFVMISVFALSFMAESGVLHLKLELMFIFAVLLSGGYLLFCLHWKQPVLIPYLIQRIACLKVFGNYGIEFYWTKIDKFKFGKLFFFSIIVNSILILAMIAPIFAQKANPDFRMTFAYGGQALNFIASIIVFVYIDRVLYSNKKDDDRAAIYKISQIVYGKIFSLFITPLLIVIFII